MTISVCVLLTAKLREYAAQLRETSSNSDSEISTKELENCLRSQKATMIKEFYRILSLHMGEPPRKFDWIYRDTKKRYHRHLNITPQQFYKEFVCVVYSHTD